jgi:polysaccharide export outer membrane protein
MEIRQRNGQRRFGLGALLAAGLLWLAACGSTGGQVVTVTDVRKDAGPAGPVLEKGLYEGLRRDDVARIEELKRTLTQKEKDAAAASLEELVGKTPSFSVTEYLAKYPESRTIGEDYKIGGYDVLSITVYGEKDLTMESVRVSADGSLSFPLIGRLNVADLNTAQVEKLIARKLSEGQYLLDAHVSVLVTKYESRKFSVLGAVKSPGHYPLQAREKVLDGISKASGIAGESDSQGRPVAGEAQEGMIIRTMNPGLPAERKVIINFDLQGLLKGRDQISNIYLADGDVIFIPKADFFYIIGEVKTPGSYAFPKKDLTIVEAISMAGGFTRIAARNKTRIVRIENGTERIYDVNVDAITKAGKMIQAVPIKPNDLIVIPESFF